MNLAGTLARFRRRAVMVTLGRRALVVVGGVAMTAEITWATGLPAWPSILSASLLGAAWAVIAVRRAVLTTTGIARRLDDVAALGDLVSTAIDVRASTSPLHPVVLRDAMREVAAIDPRRAFPFVWPRPGKAAIAAILVVQASVVALRWAPPNPIATRAAGMPGLAAEDATSGRAAGASRPAAPSRGGDTPPASAAVATAPGASATLAATPIDTVGAGASRPGDGRGGRAGPGAPSGAAGSRRVPAAYRDIVARYFTALRSSGQRHP